MNPTFMRAVDNTVGVGLCRLVTLGNRVRRALTRKEPASRCYRGPGKLRCGAEVSQVGG